jgi:hypothetical protein
MRMPTVHLNGTSREVLQHQARNVKQTLDLLIEEMGQAAPHGRDYYVLADESAFREAVEEHTERMAVLCKMKGDYERLLRHLAKGT